MEHELVEPEIEPVEQCYEFSAFGRHLWSHLCYDYDFDIKVHYVKQADANDLFGDGQFNMAALRYRDAIRIKSDCQLCWFNLGTCYLELKKSIDAVVCYRAALAGNRNLAAAVLNLGVAYLQLHRKGTNSKVWMSAALSLFHSIVAPLPLAFKAKLNELLALTERGDRPSSAKEVLELYSYLGNHLSGDLLKKFERIDPTEYQRELASQRQLRLRRLMRRNPVRFTKH